MEEFNFDSNPSLPSLQQNSSSNSLFVPDLLWTSDDLVPGSPWFNDTDNLDTIIPPTILGSVETYNNTTTTTSTLTSNQEEEENDDIIDDPQKDDDDDEEDNNNDQPSSYWLPENVYEYAQFTTGSKPISINYKKPRTVYPDEITEKAESMLNQGALRSNNTLAPNTYKNYKNVLCEFFTSPIYDGDDNLTTRVFINYILYKRRNSNISVKYETLMKKILGKYVFFMKPPRMPRRPVGGSAVPPNKYAQVYCTPTVIQLGLQNLYDKCFDTTNTLSQRVKYTNLFVCTAFQTALGCRSIDIQRLPLRVLQQLLTKANYKYMMQTNKGYRIPHQIMTNAAFMTNAQNPEFTINMKNPNDENYRIVPIGNAMMRMLMKLVDWAKTPYLDTHLSTYLDVVDGSTPILSWPKLIGPYRSAEVHSVIMDVILSLPNPEDNIKILKTGFTKTVIRALNGCLGQYLFRRYRITETYIKSGDFTSDVNTRRLVAQTLAGHTNVKQTLQYLRLADASNILNRITTQEEGRQT